jgi:hypothetical protein
MMPFYLIKISAMYKADEVDVVPSAEFVCDEDFSTNELSILDALHRLQNQFTTMAMDMPGGPLRAMTKEEIEAWRTEQREDEESNFDVVEI